MLAAYRAQRWDEAVALVEECQTLDTPRTRLRTLYALYTKRLEAFRMNPPAPSWDGSHAAATK